MYVCVCHAVTDKDIRKLSIAVRGSLFDVQNELPVGSCCGRCEDNRPGVGRRISQQAPRPGEHSCSRTPQPAL